MNINETKAELESRRKLLNALKKAQCETVRPSSRKMQNLIAKARKLQGILDIASLGESISVEQRGIRFKVLTKPARADMTLMDVFEQLGDGVYIDIERIKSDLPSVDLNVKLGSKKIEFMVFDKPGTEEENHDYIKKRRFSLEVDPKRVLYMAAVLYKKSIDGNLNESESNLYDILKNRFIRFGSGWAGVRVNDLGVLDANAHCHPSEVGGVPCGVPRSESK
ncbi:MAG: hypothetical protein KDD56_06355 [Bdellovibrionales bacterium]|nr:hypothetical protein [Bdellovibrionales bacterium]